MLAMQSRTYQKVQEHPAPWLPRRRLHGIHLQPSKCALSRAQLGGVNEQGAASTFWQCHPVLRYAPATRMHALQKRKWLAVQMEGKCSAV